jgi:hypothetical protein
MRHVGVVALIGSEMGRWEGKILYGVARAVAAARIVTTDDPKCPYARTNADDREPETAIEQYKAALVPEITALA